MAKTKKTHYELVVDSEYNKHSEKHKQDLIKVFKAIDNFQNDFTNFYDVTVETARELQNAYFLLYNIIPNDILENIKKL